MPLTTRPTGLGHGVYKDDIDYSVFCGEWCIGRIYENRSGPEDQRWFWALHSPSKPGTLRISNQVATLETAKAEFEASWKRWLEWAGLEEAPST
ncbi:MAG: hypothetical protein QOJ58_2 [Alphaproteobacteria bacterium]|nr:hypothetical protein [Alphaproteobacteria bacterium]